VREQGVRFIENARPNALLDVWSFLQRTWGAGFLAARDDGRLVGYALFVPSLRAVQRSAVFSGAVFKWIARGVSGQYDMRPGRLTRTLRNKLYFLFQGHRFRTHGDAQLLNVAVEPEAQGRGIAKGLINVGLQALHALKVPEVRLEVRPSNAAAIALYFKTGWREVGRTRDLEGEWIVMVANP